MIDRMAAGAAAIAVFTLSFADMARGQAGHGLKYEAASIRPAHPEERMTRIEVQYTGSFQGTRVSLRDMVLYAYAVGDYQVSGGPKWAATERYDVRTKPAEPDLGRHSARDRERLRNLLIDRFQLVVRREMRHMPVHALTIAKGGHKMKPAKTGTGTFRVERGVLWSEGVHMDFFKSALPSILGRPILDETGLTGPFAFRCEWTPDAPEPRLEDPLPPFQRLATQADGAALTALREQLGLRVVAKKGPVETIVIEKAERPSEN